MFIKNIEKKHFCEGIIDASVNAFQLFSNVFFVDPLYLKYLINLLQNYGKNNCTFSR